MCRVEILVSLQPSKIWGMTQKTALFLIIGIVFSNSVLADPGTESNPPREGTTNPLYLDVVTTPVKKLQLNKTQARPDIPGKLLLEVGFNFVSGAPDSLKTSFWGSKTFNVYYFWEKQIGSSGFTFNPGIGIGTEKLDYKEDVTLSTTPGDSGIVSIESFIPGADVRKTKLALTYLDIPIEVTYHTNKENFKKSFRAGIGGRVGLLINSHTKVVYKLNDYRKTLKMK